MDNEPAVANEFMSGFNHVFVLINPACDNPGTFKTPAVALRVNFKSISRVEIYTINCIYIQVEFNSILTYESIPMTLSTWTYSETVSKKKVGRGLIDITKLYKRQIKGNRIYFHYSAHYF